MGPKDDSQNILAAERPCKRSMQRSTLGADRSPILPQKALAEIQQLAFMSIAYDLIHSAGHKKRPQEKQEHTDSSTSTTLLSVGG